MKETQPIPKCSGSKTGDSQPSSKNALNSRDFNYLLTSDTQYISKRLWNLFRNESFYTKRKSQ
jgi:hypothetical protein